MAVFTKLVRDEISNFIELYDIGKLEDFYEIVEGIENTNYKIICNGIPYILTIFEKRVNEEDLPFFINLKIYLNENNFKCPKPIANKDDKVINSIRGKKAIIISFIEGSKVILSDKNNCYEVGRMVGNLHNISKKFGLKRNNSLNIYELKKIFNKCLTKKSVELIEIFNELQTEINSFENGLPVNLPSGIIHADLFKDNIFFNNGKISGVIDFYFSCYDFFLYDISIIVNDWCFLNNGKEFNKVFFQSIIEGYNLNRSLNSDEIMNFNIILRLATVRILITRLHDYIFHPNDAIVIKKDPFEYLNILKWHKTNSVI